ncbi:MAG: CDP-alcohol phosphatidyltransferase family protein [Planctomycetota bacterium]|nr:CDP-alcohol phosphatidyltransferase family protein [Planctomycetota bacterium]
MLKLVPNILTVGRLVLTVFLLIMLLYSPNAQNRTLFLDAALVIFVIAGITDIVDGPIARHYGIATKFGRIMDPLADKILVCGAFISFAWIGEPTLFNLTPTTLKIIHWLVAGIIIAREAYVTILRHTAEAHGINFAATASGKIKMFLQSFAIGTTIIKMAHAQNVNWGYWFISITFSVMLIGTVVSGLTATRRASWKQFSLNNRH